MTPPIMGITINTVSLSPEFRAIVYLVIAAALIIGTIAFTSKRYNFPDAFRKSLMAAFFASGILYAVHADIGWGTWLAEDMKKYGGLSTNDKLGAMEGGLYEFALQAQKKVSGDYQVFSSDGYLEHRLQYFLLPQHKREQAPYIVVIADNDARYDPGTRSFTRGAVTVTNVEPILVFAQNAYILKRP